METQAVTGGWKSGWRGRLRRLQNGQQADRAGWADWTVAPKGGALGFGLVFPIRTGP